MPQLTWRLLGLVLTGFLFAMSLPAAARAETPTILAETKPLPPQINKDGRVTVTVTPLTIAADTWRFEVELDTHVVPLDQDLTAVSLLVDQRGNEQRPLTWEGDPPGGHHRKGVLVFKSVGPLPTVVTLKIRGIGPVPERAFTWTLGAP